MPTLVRVEFSPLYVILVGGDVCGFGFQTFFSNTVYRKRGDEMPYINGNVV